ncbi:MAG: response regulator [Cyanobacteriota bacterium]|nr:response regulator [Cyanobacteriota bacterium]
MKKPHPAIKGSILIVEDEKIIAKDIATVLKKFGYTVHHLVGSGDEAIKKLEEGQFDLVLMDIVLKGDLDGVEVAKQVYERFHTPVVFLTAYADDDTLDRAKETELFGYVIKPFQERELYTAIEIALHKHRVNIEKQLTEEKKLEDLKQGLQKLQQFSDIKDVLFKKFLKDLSDPLFNLNVAIELLKDSSSAIKRDHYMRILEEEFAREVELINQTSNLQDLLSVENVELLSQFSLLRKKVEAPDETASPASLFQPASGSQSGLSALPYAAKSNVSQAVLERPVSKRNMRPLNQTQLSERLGVVVSAITYWKQKPGFSEWSRSKDPDGVTWRYSPDSKRFIPD